MYASKIAALLNRGAIKDLYDISNMIDNNIIHNDEMNLLRKCVIFYLIINKNKDELLNYEQINNMNYHQVKTDLLPVIRKKENFDLENTKTKINEFLTNLFILNDNEKEFIELFYSGIYNPKLLFDENDVIHRISNHPMIMWKLQHIIEYINNKIS